MATEGEIYQMGKYSLTPRSAQRAAPPVSDAIHAR